MSENAIRGAVDGEGSWKEEIWQIFALSSPNRQMTVAQRSKDKLALSASNITPVSLRRPPHTPDTSRSGIDIFLSNSLLGTPCGRQTSKSSKARLKKSVGCKHARALLKTYWKLSNVSFKQ